MTQKHRIEIKKNILCREPDRKESQRLLRLMAAAFGLLSAVNWD